MPLGLCWCHPSRLCPATRGRGRPAPLPVAAPSVDLRPPQVTLLTTVGYGDLIPTTAAGKVVAILYVLVSLSLVASSLGAIVSQLADPTVTTRTRGPPDVCSLYWGLVRALLLLVAMIGVGTTWAVVMEGYAPIDAVFWATMSATSVGLAGGDADGTRTFNIVYLFVGVGPPNTRPSQPKGHPPARRRQRCAGRSARLSLAVA